MYTYIFDVSNLKHNTFVCHLRARFVFFSLVLAMAPKNASAGNASARKRSRCEVKGFIPLQDIVVEPPAEVTNELAEAVQVAIKLSPSSNVRKRMTMAKLRPPKGKGPAKAKA